MIRIEFSFAIAIHLFFTTCFILFLWIFLEKRKVFEPFSSEKRFFWQCNVCTYVYVDSMHNVISQCPRCGSYNKKESNEATTYGTE